MIPPPMGFNPSAAGSATVLDTSGANHTKYVRGINLIASAVNGSALQYFLHNAHGDVVQLANSSGTITKAYDYDAFGVEKDIDPNDTNPFRYCGEYIDLETNTYYLRARYYQPTIGRFMTEDTVRSVRRKMPNGMEIDDPLSLNLYTYCHNNPIMYTDPSGYAPSTYKRDDGMYGFLPDYKFVNVIISVSGFAPIPFADKGIQWIVDKAAGTETISSKNISDVVKSTLSDTVTAVSMLEYMKYLNYSSEFLSALKTVGSAFGTVGNILTGFDVIATWTDNTPIINQITKRMFGTSMVSNSREGVIFKYAVFSNIVTELVKNKGVTYTVKSGSVTNLKVDWDIYDKMVKEMGVDTKVISELFR